MRLAFLLLIGAFAAIVAADDNLTASGDSTEDGGERSGFENPYQPIGGSSSSIDGNSLIGTQCQSLRYRNKCYFLALSKESWHTARDYCARIGYTLARIESSDEATYLASYLRDTGSNQFWVDLNDERTEGVWTHSDGSAAFTDFWARNEPNGNRGENCGLLVAGNDRVGRLVDDPCGEWRKFICERPSETVCRRAGYKKKCYWFSVQPSTWFNSREYCATMGVSQRLARVTSTDEINFLARIMPRPSWIDLRYGGQGVGWTYADGSSSSGMSSWFGGASSYGYGQRCAELNRYNSNEGRCIGQDCNALRQFICESQPLPAGSELVNPEDEEGSVIGSPIGGPAAVGPAGPVNPMDPQMGGGVPGMGYPPPMGGYPMGGGGYPMGGGGYPMGGGGYPMGGGYGMGGGMGGGMGYGGYGRRR